MPIRQEVSPSNFPAMTKGFVARNPARFHSWVGPHVHPHAHIRRQTLSACPCSQAEAVSGLISSILLRCEALFSSSSKHSRRMTFETGTHINAIDQGWKLSQLPNGEIGSPPDVVRICNNKPEPPCDITWLLLLLVVLELDTVYRLSKVYCLLCNPSCIFSPYTSLSC